LHRLSDDEDNYVRSGAASALGYVFPHIQDKQQAWNDLHRLSNDKDSNVRGYASYILGSAYFHIPDEHKQQAWSDLQRLTSDENQDARVCANHFFGKFSIFKASQAQSEENYKNELEKAIRFFENATESSYRERYPAQFCLPFYRSFYTIIFKKQEAQEEVDKYLAEAKEAVKDSKSKKLLIEAVENLATALEEIQNLENLDLGAMKGELNFYRKYCDRAAELITDTEETAPYATELVRKGLPIFDRNLKRLLEEIQEKAKIACRISQGTPTQEIACAVNTEIQKWEIGNQEEMGWYVENLIFTLESSIPKELENQAIFNKIEQIRNEKILVRQYAILCSIIPVIPNLHVKQAISGIANDVYQIKKTVDTLTIAFKPGIKQEIEISSGIEILGTGAKLITTIPLQEISYAEIKEDLQKIEGKHINKLSEFPKRLASRIKGYLLLNDREDIVEQLT
jgi:hypothetical protein